MCLAYEEDTRTVNAGWQEALKMESKRLRPGDTLNLEKLIHILETPFSEVCELFGLDSTEPQGFLEFENCIFLFDSEKEYVFSGAIVMGGTYGFFGIQVGANWLDAAGTLESQGFKQASDLERFTLPGEDFSLSVYLYPDDCPDASLSKVKDYSVCVRYGQTL
jgi:hypothetical protein